MRPAALLSVLLNGERRDRAVALAGTLEALASHLERISGRRKTLLLFSEGIDYDQADVLGKVQRSANDVMQGMSRAIGALMRTNVALYAVDPRALNSADADLLETPIYNPTAVPTRTVADEQTDSIRTLHSLSESTGGFAAVNRNDFTRAFERIDLESSSYYVIGYSPERPAKPGEFRSIQVKVSRPDVRISARNGYSGKAEIPVRRTVSDYPANEPASGFPMPSARGRGRAGGWFALRIQRAPGCSSRRTAYRGDRCSHRYGETSREPVCASNDARSTGRRAGRAGDPVRSRGPLMFEVMG